MKSFFTYLAVASAFSPLAFAAPASDNTLNKRLGPADGPAALATLDTLFTGITQHTAIINSTAAAYPKEPTAADKATASTAFKSQIASIDSLIVAATSEVKGLSKRETVMIKRQDAATGLPAELALIIEEIGGALNEIIATLGLTATLSFLGPLVTSLSGLLASLIPVVNNLLTVVEELLDGILGGLSVALADLVL
ncbi:hypothetical protein P7C71_g2153, partial [Lecanoromycetidae sp. Uapishka_2]